VFILVAAAGVGFLTGVPKTVLVMVGFSFFITVAATAKAGRWAARRGHRGIP